jgi:hypothetical protein
VLPYTREEAAARSLLPAAFEWLPFTYSGDTIYVAFRRNFGYGQTLTDDQFRLLEPLIPPAKPGGRPRSTAIRNLLDVLSRAHRLPVAASAAASGLLIVAYGVWLHARFPPGRRVGE